ncbi:MAG: hypothetical protein K2X27_07435 [Candidatus Obscuribacterales bacterium]|nr:hypothetical protein [Candidatus Obscuribacterales bacterium]
MSLEQLSVTECKNELAAAAGIVRPRSFKAGIASALSLLITCSQFLPAALAQSNKTTPSGTLLLPLTPKLDSADAPTPSALAPLPKSAKAPKKKIATSTSSDAARAIVAPIAAPILPAAPAIGAPESPVPPVEAPSGLSGEISSGTGKTQSTKTDADEPDIAKLEEENDNTLLKGTVQIVADDTEYDQVKNTFLGTGNAVATIAGQDARLEADMILYDQASEMLDARGNVKIVRQGQVSTGSSFKFKVSSDEYLITSPDTEVQGTNVIARTGYGAKDGLRFREGTMELPEPIMLSRNTFYGTVNSANETFHKTIHPDAYIPEKPSFVFKARKMVYERYKESGNLTVFGGKLMFGKFGVPLGKFTATVGKEANVTFPVTPFVGNNIMVGGINLGPMFNTALPGDRVFSWAPLVQFGGRNEAYTNANQTKRGSIGAGFRMSFRGKKLSANLAYGSVSNILVGDVKYRMNDKQMFQGGINRFIPNGLFGSQRARAIAEFVDTRGVGNIPYLQGITFRSSAGWASDSPALLNTTPEYKQLFKIQNGNITNAYRLQEQIMTSTQPIFSVGNQRTGATMNFFGGVAGRGYSTGDTMLMGQVGPVFNLNLNKLRLQGSVMKSGVNGQSPFVFDQYIQGNQSGQFGGSFKICKWLDIGGNLGYNMDNKMFYQKQISAAIGPDDFKFLISHDTIRGINRFGFDFMYGQPIPFNKLILKGSPDHGQLGGGI